jgi:hypothetical protein
MMARMGTPRRRTVGIALGAVVLASLAGCSLRRETPPIVTPSPDQYEQLREAAAQAEVDIVDALAADVVGAGTAGYASFVQAETASVMPHLDALGGVYVPFPSATPSATPSASPSATPSVSASPPPKPKSLTRAVADARDADLAAALIAEDPDLALLLASIGLSHAQALAVSAYQDGIAAGSTPLAAERIMVGASFADLVPATTGLDASALEGIIVAHDYAAYVYEVIAARSSDEARTQALERSRIHEHRADELVAIAAADPRVPAYVIDHANLESEDAMAALARTTEAEISDRYITAFFGAAQMGAPGLGDRGWLLAGAYDSLAQSVLWPGATPAEADPLPGVVLAQSQPAPS